MTDVAIARRPIRQLPGAVAEQIAAGEVIDRPAAVAKELIENALDAGSTRITVEARGGGLELLRVSDDGHGIAATEVTLAFARHATSKLATVDDLLRLHTLGFRGEALPSIAAVAEVTLTSAVAGEPVGHMVSLRYGERREHGPRARAPGTTVAVRALFGNVPARRAFLREQRVESARIGEVVRRYALGRPAVAFSLAFDGRPAFQSSGDGDARHAFAALYGAAALEGVAPVAADLPNGGRLHGFVGTAGPWHGGRTHLNLFVNGRWVRGGGVAVAVESGYRPFVPAGKHPLALLHVSLPADQIDANIHPAKLEVRLRDEAAVAEAIREALAVAYGRTPTGAPALTRQFRLPLDRRVADEPAAYDAAPRDPDFAALRLLAVTRHGLLVVEGPDGLWLVDPHRAHERLLYEALTTAPQAEPQALLEPALLGGGLDRALLASRAVELAALGFALEEFGGGALIVRGAPAALGALAPDALAALLREALADAAGWRDRLLATAACHAAVKKGQPVAWETATDLLGRLAGVRSPAVCPHGSPVVVRLSDGMLARLFRW